MYTIVLVLPIVFCKDAYDEFVRPKKRLELFDLEVVKWGLSAFALVFILAFGVLDNTQFIYSGF